MSPETGFSTDSSVSVPYFANSIVNPLICAIRMQDFRKGNSRCSKVCLAREGVRISTGVFVITREGVRNSMGFFEISREGVRNSRRVFVIAREGVRNSSGRSS